LGTSKNPYALSDIADMLIQGETTQELLVAFAIPFGYKWFQRSSSLSAISPVGSQKEGQS